MSELGHLGLGNPKDERNTSDLNPGIPEQRNNRPLAPSGMGYSWSWQLNLALRRTPPAVRIRFRNGGSCKFCFLGAICPLRIPRCSHSLSYVHLSHLRSRSRQNAHAVIFGHFGPHNFRRHTRLYVSRSIEANPQATASTIEFLTLKCAEFCQPSSSVSAISNAEVHATAVLSVSHI